eukprot:Seg17195.1 transcript_id=Seg17195.1/GoldUCD/mRNA.D3Y31 product="hypothetical protein" protein_id=Seg17195.1/GoldUCD/D3Y31
MKNVIKKWILSEDLESKEDLDSSSNVVIDFFLPKVEGCFCVVSDLFPIELPSQYYIDLPCQSSIEDWDLLKSELISQLGRKLDSETQWLSGSGILPLSFTPPSEALKVLWQINATASDCLIVHQEVIDVMLDKCGDDIFSTQIHADYYLIKIIHKLNMPINRFTEGICPSCGRYRYNIIDGDLQIKSKSLDFDGHIRIIDTTSYVIISDSLKKELSKLANLNASFDAIGEYLTLVE